MDAERMIKVFGYGLILNCLVRGNASTDLLVETLKAERQDRFASMFHFVSIDGTMYKIQKSN